MRSLKAFWQRIDGPLGLLLLAGAMFNVGYVVRGYEDGGFVATLIERIRYARTDERNQCDMRLTQLAEGYRERAKIRDAQVATLTDQYRTLGELIRKGALARAETLRKATEAAEAAKQAASSADAATKKADIVDKKLDTATQPTAVVPHHPWIGNQK